MLCVVVITHVFIPVAVAMDGWSSDDEEYALLYTVVCTAAAAVACRVGLQAAKRRRKTTRAPRSKDVWHQPEYSEFAKYLDEEKYAAPFTKDAQLFRKR